MIKHRAQKVRRDFEVAVGLKQIVAGRAHMMEHEDGADARQQRPQHAMRACKIQGVKSGANNVVA